ncbi:hypothetical protein niasHS_009003 [Heterodera schachtii]|uniref:Uncharacterized protein n=1 Tax=Heterodera schachtii TaxID=97005 RepID=A0ABD2J5L0_HETSC
MWMLRFKTNGKSFQRTKMSSIGENARTGVKENDSDAIVVDRKDQIIVQQLKPVAENWLPPDQNQMLGKRSLDESYKDKQL